MIQTVFYKIYIILNLDELKICLGKNTEHRFVLR
jgi:hypothetical protein